MAQADVDIIYIRGLEVDTFIGIYDWEQHTRQPLLLDIEIELDIFSASATDDISDTCNYSSVSERVTHYIESNHFNLIESVADRVAQLILQEFKVTKTRIRVSKPGAVSNAEDVGVIIERMQSSKKEQDKGL